MRRKASILRVAVRHLEAARPPKWIEPAIKKLIDSGKIRGLNSFADLKTIDRATGSIWKWFQKDYGSIMIEVRKTRQQIIVYESEGWREAIEDELKYLLRDSPDEAYQRFGSLINLEMRAGDVMAFASEEAQRVRENLTDELESGSMDAEDIISQANLNDQWEEAQDLLAEYEKYPEYDYRSGYAADARQTLFELPKTAIEEIAAEKYREVEEALERYPYEYLTEDMGFDEGSAIAQLEADVDISVQSIMASVPLQPSHGGKEVYVTPYSYYVL